MLYSYIIYKLTFPNGKVYIGQTILEFNKRLNQHKSNAYNKKYKRYNALISRAIRKYGWDNIKKEILCTVTEEFVDELETKMIAEYNATDKRFGYNILKIGESRKGFRHSEESKQLMSKSHIGINSGKNHPMYGIKRPDLSERNKNNIKPVIVYNKKTKKYVGTFKSVKLAGIKLNLYPQHISRNLTGKRNSAGGYIFNYG